VKTKILTVAASVLVMTMSIGSAAFACEDGSCDTPPPPPETTKGNNGWGNGPDSTNAGSFSGGTAVTKSVNGLGADKFDGKFDGR
jgi:hypothetical protein